LNRYDLNHSCAPHPQMPRGEWERAYKVAWETYYTMEHMETVLRRVAEKRGKVSNTVLLLTWFKGSIHFEKIHPLEGGFFRLKFRRDRRSGFPIVPAWRFYPRYAAETVGKMWKWASLYFALHRVYARIKRDAGRLAYMDLALTPVTDDEIETHELYHAHVAKAGVFATPRRAQRAGRRWCSSCHDPLRMGRPRARSRRPRDGG